LEMFSSLNASLRPHEALASFAPIISAREGVPVGVIVIIILIVPLSSD